MSLQYLDPQTIGSLLSCTWQQDLGTSEDPANGQWYTDGANCDGIGLYGGLSDSLPTQVQLDAAAAVVKSQQIVADSAIAQNLFGTDPSPAVQLTYGYVTSVSNMYEQIPAVSNGSPFHIPMQQVLSQGPESIDIRFVFASPQATAPTQQGQQFSRAVQVAVPTGRVYQVVLAVQTQQATVPYTVQIAVTGTTETWFANPVNGHYNWKADAGTAFGRINQYNCAGVDSAAYGAGGNGAGTVTLKGVLNVSEVGSFCALVYDVTAQCTAGGAPPALTPGSAPPSGTVVQTIPL